MGGYDLDPELQHCKWGNPHPSPFVSNSIEKIYLSHPFHRVNKERETNTYKGT